LRVDFRRRFTRRRTPSARVTNGQERAEKRGKQRRTECPRGEGPPAEFSYIHFGGEGRRVPPLRKRGWNADRSNRSAFQDATQDQFIGLSGTRRSLGSRGASRTRERARSPRRGCRAPRGGGDSRCGRR